MLVFVQFLQSPTRKQWQTRFVVGWKRGRKYSMFCFVGACFVYGMSIFQYNDLSFNIIYELVFRWHFWWLRRSKRESNKPVTSKISLETFLWRFTFSSWIDDFRCVIDSFLFRKLRWHHFLLPDFHLIEETRMYQKRHDWERSTQKTWQVCVDQNFEVCYCRAWFVDVTMMHQPVRGSTNAIHEHLIVLIHPFFCIDWFVSHPTFLKIVSPSKQSKEKSGSTTLRNIQYDLPTGAPTHQVSHLF